MHCSAISLVLLFRCQHHSGFTNFKDVSKLCPTAPREQMSIAEKLSDLWGLQWCPCLVLYGLSLYICWQSWVYLGHSFHVAMHCSSKRFHSSYLLSLSYMFHLHHCNSPPKGRATHKHYGKAEWASDHTDKDGGSIFFPFKEVSPLFSVHIFKDRVSHYDPRLTD